MQFNWLSILPASNTNRHSIIFIFLLLISLASCSKESKQNDTPPATTPPVITSISPTHAPKNALDTILGSGFSANAQSNTVMFNGKAATIVSATNGQLVVRVPAQAGDGEITVTVGGATARGPQFRYEAFSVRVFAGAGYLGYTDGIGVQASLSTPVCIAPDSAGNLFVAEAGNNIIRKITPAAVVSRYAGTVRKQGTTDGPALNASFQYVYSVCTDAAGNVYAGDVYAYNVRKITPDGITSIYAPRAAQPTGITFDKEGILWSVGPQSGALERIDKTGKLTDIYIDGSGALWDVIPDLNGNLLISDQDLNIIYKFLPADRSSSVFAGKKYNAGFVDGKMDTALFNKPKAIAMDKQGNIYVADQGNNAIRKISTDGMVSTLLTGVSHYTLDGGGAFSGAWGLCVAKDGNLYITNTGESTILQVVFD